MRTDQLGLACPVVSLNRFFGRLLASVFLCTRQFDTLFHTFQLQRVKGGSAMPKRSVSIAILILLLLALVGCSKNLVVNLDGMPISNHEYNLTNDETKIRAVFILTRYFKEYEGKEDLIKPDYLDALLNNWIDPDNTERLLLHVKVVNLNKAKYSFFWEVAGPKDLKASGHVYNGTLSRKDFYIKLPYNNSGDYTYGFKLTDANGTGLFDLPEMRYKVKGGDRYSSQ